jgi:hypothetical protein
MGTGVASVALSAGCSASKGKVALESVLRVDQGPFPEACGIRDVRNWIASSIGCAGAVDGGPWTSDET